MHSASVVVKYLLIRQQKAIGAILTHNFAMPAIDFSVVNVIFSCQFMYVSEFRELHIVVFFYK